MDADAKNDEAASGRGTLPFRVGGPDTLLPSFAESFLCWTLFIPCSAISGHHYGKELAASSAGWPFVVYRRARGIVRGLMLALFGDGSGC